MQVRKELNPLPCSRRRRLDCRLSRRLAFQHTLGRASAHRRWSGSSDTDPHAGADALGIQRHHRGNANDGETRRFVRELLVGRTGSPG